LGIVRSSDRQIVDRDGGCRNNAVRREFRAK
jgi:hypothetical protein